MKNLFFFSLLTVSMAAQLRYSQIRVPISSAAEMNRLASLGLAVDHYGGKMGTAIDFFVNEEEESLLRQNNISYTTIVPDWDAHYRQTLQRVPSVSPVSISTPKNFRYGSMGGFLTMAEVIQQLDSMEILYPSLVSGKDSIGSTIEGRPIYAVKISDNPSVAEGSEPEVLYTALHHAREPEGMMTVIYFMWWLLENYGKNAEATYLVDQRQLWFIPIVNPDGYVYNQMTNPNGGGMHRKNRRNVGTTVKGVDLNRNYGPHFMWNFPNPAGSSTSANSETYRGTAPFSEPETFAIKNFLANHSVKTCLNYHTYGNYLIYPWGYNSQESNDSLLFRYWSYEMSMVNRFTIGTDMQTVGYSTRGSSDDFMYSDSGKAVTYAMTPEVGISEYDTTTGSGFWPMKSKIIPLAEENLGMNKILAYSAGANIGIRSFSFDQTSISIVFINKGLQTSASTTLSLSTSQGTITPSITLSPIPPFGEQKAVVNYSALSLNDSSSARVNIVFQDPTGSFMVDSIEFIAGTPSVLLADSAQSTLRWSTGTGWGIITELADNNKAFTDSPGGKYSANSDNALTLLSPVLLSGYQYAVLEFRTQWAIESTWDFGTVEISTDAGTTWNSLKTKLSRKGSGRSGSRQSVNAYGYDAFTPGLTWTHQTADLTPYIGKQVTIRFRLSADAGFEHDGWYIDDIRLLGYRGNPNSVIEKAPPSTFALLQNFPNPFNPVTTVTFSLEERQRAVLSVYNTVGQEIAVLVDQELPAGNHSVIFDAKQLSSGVYFYRLLAGKRIAIKKMTVVK